MRQSMTGFASVQGGGQGYAWTWEVRGVNGKGLDLRLRLPDWIEWLEPEVRKRVVAALSRGNVQISLRLHSESGTETLRVDDGQLSAVLDAMERIEAEAGERGIAIKPSTAADVLALRGILSSETPSMDGKTLLADLLKDFEQTLAAFTAMRRKEGTSLQALICGSLTRSRS